MKKLIIFIMLLVTTCLLLGCTVTVDPKEDPIDNDDDTQDVIDDDDDPADDDDDPMDVILNQANDILNTLSLEQKIGQMFIVGFSGTSMPTSLATAIENYYFGNVIYFAGNVANPSTIINLSTDIQETIIAQTGIPGFISADQEGGLVARLTNGGTHFVGNMALGAIGNRDEVYQVGSIVGQELRHYGINLNLAPVLDVNNNANNPIIGVRSYSDNPSVVADFGIQMIKGLASAGVMATAKHFPGHGDTHIDSHYGLPTIPYDLERLYEIELFPYLEAIDNGLDAIMTAHILFSAIDTTYPATLSYKVITELLREALGFNGIVMTDAMNMNAIRNHFGNAEASILAIQAGVDILTYTESTTTSVQAYQAVLSAVNNEIITEARIDESVRRILIQKIKYGLLDDYLPSEALSNSDFAAHQAFSNQLAKDSLTLAKGGFDGLEANKSTLIISTICTRYALLPGYATNSSLNSLAYIATTALQAKGFNHIDYEVIGNTLTSTQIQNLVNKAKDYDQVIIAFENASSSQRQLTTLLFSDNEDLIVIALRNPYDINHFPEVNHYVCVYGYFDATVFALIAYLNGEFVAEGVLPVYVAGLE